MSQLTLAFEMFCNYFYFTFLQQGGPQTNPPVSKCNAGLVFCFHIVRNVTCLQEASNEKEQMWLDRLPVI